MANKSTATKVISVVVALAVAAVAVGLGVYLFLSHSGGNSNDGPVLGAVKNITYHEDTYTFSWDGVEHADTYAVEINGENTTVSENQIIHVPVEKETRVRVKPVDSEGEYASPDWSAPYVYVLGDGFSYSSVASYVNGATSGQLRKLVTVYVKDNILYTDSVFLHNGEIKLMQLKINYDEPVSSIADCMSKQYSVVSIASQYQIADYDSANYFLQSSEYVGELEERRLEGYSFGVVTSQVTKYEEERNGYNIFAIYKLTKGDEVKYVASNVRCSVRNESSNERVNYTTKLLNPEDVFNVEFSYNELKGDEIDLALAIQNINGAIAA